MTQLDTPIFGPLPPGYRRPGPHTNGSAATSPRATANRSKDYVSAVRHQPAGLPRVLDAVIDEVTREQGPYVYEAMDLDPACKAAKRTLLLSILAGGMDMSPADEPDAGVKELTPDQTLAKELVDEMWRNAERLEDFEGVLVDLLDACVTGCKLARPVMELAKDGEDAGKLVLKALTVKPRDAWRFVVDDFMNVLEIEAVQGPDGQKVRYPADGFVWLTWDKQDNDPRGRSIYRAANEPWNLKYSNYPEYHTYLKQFASGMITGSTAPGETNRAEIDPVTRLPTGEEITPEQYMAQELGGLGNGRAFVGPAESKVNIVFPSGDGAPFREMFDWVDRQITLAILGTANATLEAKHDSRANGETGQDILGLEAERGRKLAAACVRRVWRLLIGLNHGEDVAARLTPLVTFGQAEQQDRAALWSAAATLWANGQGYMGESQRAEVDTMIGLPVRDAEADEAKAKARAEEAVKQQQALAPPVPVKPGAPKPPDGKPPVKPKPAEFALDAPLPGPWHDADMIAARGLLNAVMPSAAALKRWSEGSETAENRRVLLSYLVDDCKARLRSEGESLLRELAAVDLTAPAEFASPWETVARWRDGVARTLRRFYVAGALALTGPAEFSPAEMETLRDRTTDQLDYLDGFAGDVMSRRQARDGTLVSRSGMYGDSTWVVSMAVERTRMVGLGMTREHSRLGASKDSCGRDGASELGVPSCRQEQAKGWQPIGTLTLPGKRKCKGACKCHMEYR